MVERFDVGLDPKHEVVHAGRFVEEERAAFGMDERGEFGQEGGGGVDFFGEVGCGSVEGAEFFGGGGVRRRAVGSVTAHGGAGGGGVALGVWWGWG